MTDTRYATEFRSRFPDRRELTHEDLIREHFLPLGCNHQHMISLLELLEMEFRVPAGLLRPADRLDVLFQPVSTRNPVRWIEYQTRAADAKSELNYQLVKRLDAFGIPYGSLDVNTVRQLALAWCGVPEKVATAPMPQL